MKSSIYSSIASTTVAIALTFTSANATSETIQRVEGGSYDSKSMSAYGCFPQTGKQQSDFYYGAGAIINKTGHARNVVCTIFRDRFGARREDSSSRKEVGGIEVHFFRDHRGAHQPFACQSFIRDLHTGDVMDGHIRKSYSTGDGSLTLPALDYFSKYDVIYMFCRLPAHSKIKGFMWSEYMSTDYEYDVTEDE